MPWLVVGSEVMIPELKGTVRWTVERVHWAAVPGGFAVHLRQGQGQPGDMERVRKTALYCNASFCVPFLRAAKPGERGFAGMVTYHCPIHGDVIACACRPI